MAYYEVSSGQVSSGIIINDADNMAVLSGGTAVDTLVTSPDWPGRMCVSSGGTASQTVVDGGSLQVIDGTLIDTVVSNGGNVHTYYYGSRNYAVISDMRVGSGGWVRIYYARTVDNVEVESGGSFSCDPGDAVLNNIIVRAGGKINGFLMNEDFAFTGSFHISGAVVSEGTAILYQNQIGSNITVANSGCLFSDDVSPGVLVGTVVQSGGSLEIDRGSVLTDTTIEYGGIINGFVFESDVFIASGVNLSGGIVTADRHAEVEEGQSATDTRVLSGGRLTVSKGLISNTSIAAGAEINGFVFESDTFISSGLHISGGTVTTSASLYSGQSAENLTVAAGGRLRLYENDASISNVTVKANGRFDGFILSQDSDTFLEKTPDCISGGIVQGDWRPYDYPGMEDAGYWTYEKAEVEEGMTASGTVVNAGGHFRIDQTSAYDTIVNSGGSLTQEDGGVAVRVAVNNGGYVQVGDEDGSGSASYITVSSGGSMHVGDADWTEEMVGFASHTTVLAGGTMTMDKTGTHRGTLMIEDGAEVSADSGSVIDFTVSEMTASDPARINNISLIQGTPDFTITVSSDQADGTYTLAGGAAGFGGSLTIGTDGSNYGSLAVNGASLNYGKYTFTLATSDSDLLLTVSGSAPAAGGHAGDLNADGRADIVMTITEVGHGGEGATGAWLILEDQTAAWGDLSTRGSDWEIFGTGKTAAGKSTDDVYIRSTGNIIGAWTTGDDGKVTGWETIGEFASDAQVLGLGDFNGNGQSDLLLRAANGAVGCFFTNGQGWNYFQSLGDEWKLTVIGDLNGDGRDDVVLKHDAGFAGSWLTQADGTMAWADLDTLPTGFEIVGAGDFNGDGTDDVLLKSGNYYGAWLVNNGNAVGWMGLGDLGNVTVEQIADFNGDGKDDLRIRTAAGDLGAQLVMDADNLVWKYYGSVGSEWSTSLAALA